MKLSKKPIFIYTQNEKNPEYNFYQCCQVPEFKIYDYLLELDFDNKEYQEFFDHFKEQYHISRRLFTFILEELVKNNVKEFGKEVVVDMSKKPIYIPGPKRERIPRLMPKNIKFVHNSFYIRIMINRVFLTQYLSPELDIEKVIVVRDEMRRLGRTLTIKELDVVLGR